MEVLAINGTPIDVPMPVGVALARRRRIEATVTERLRKGHSEEAILRAYGVGANKK